MHHSTIHDWQQKIVLIDARSTLPGALSLMWVSTLAFLTISRQDIHTYYYDVRRMVCAHFYGCMRVQKCKLTKR